MGKKRIIQKGEKELRDQADAIEQAGDKKAGSSSPSKKMKEGIVYVYASYNNTIMSLTDPYGNVIGQVSAGAVGFKGTKKSTPFAASKVADAIAQIAKNKGIEKIAVQMRGVGPGRDSALRSIGAKGFDLVSIIDATPVPHNGPRPKKTRRV